MSTHAQAAKQIRIELKKVFPSTTFRVTSKTYSGGNSIRVSWIDGQTSEQVNKIIDKYQHGNFDGMTDSYEMNNCRSDISQVKYVFAEREISNDIKVAIFKILQESYNLFDTVSNINDTSELLMKHWGVWTAGQYINRITSKLDLSNGFKGEI